MSNSHIACRDGNSREADHENRKFYVRTGNRSDGCVFGCGGACRQDDGKLKGQVLTGAKGMTLYTFDKDGKGMSSCYDSCAKNWPPFMASKGAKASGGYSLVKRKDGSKQWAKDGMPLYYWVKDKKPGDVTGTALMGSGTQQSHEAGLSQSVPDSFEGQLLALLPIMRRYSRSLAKSDAEGEDLLQDCVAKALARRGQWRGLNLRGWILTMMTNLYRNSYKSRARVRYETLDAAENVSSSTGETDPFQLELLENAINTLPEDNRAVLMLVVVEGYSYGEAAAMLDIPVGTVMSRLSRARQRLAEHMSGSNVVTLRRSR